MVMVNGDGDGDGDGRIFAKAISPDIEQQLYERPPFISIFHNSPLVLCVRRELSHYKAN